MHIKIVLKRGVDLYIYRLKRRKGEARNNNLFACFNHNSASYFSSNLELDLRLVYFSSKIELDLRLVYFSSKIELDLRLHLQLSIII
jgi:hypothetical protein